MAGDSVAQRQVVDWSGLRARHCDRPFGRGLRVTTAATANALRPVHLRLLGDPPGTMVATCAGSALVRLRA
jgi:hypothetical protein